MDTDENLEKVQRIDQIFNERFGATPQLSGVAPGRVNLIGEHTDYNGGFVFPAAIDKQAWIAARATDGPSKLFSKELGESREFDAGSVKPGDVPKWGAYGAGVAWALRERTGKPMPNIEAALHGEVPIASGISSSASVELAFAVAWNELAGLGLSNKELALVGQACENKFVGLNSGIMDQMASAMGKQDHAMFLDTRSLDIRYAPIPEELEIVLCDTGKPRALTDSAYNERRLQCETAAKALGKEFLRDVELRDLEAAKERLEPVIYKRALHVITEDDRCLAFAKALEAKDFRQIGELMKASHVSLRDDYEVSSRELDAMADAAWSAEGCVGARMTGAGFGGACVALVRRETVDDFIRETGEGYRKGSGMKGKFLRCRAAQGARVL